MKSKAHSLFLLLIILCMLILPGTGALAASPNNWSYENGYWYHYDSDGNAQTGWQKIGVRWYYFNADGEMQTGWQMIGGKWYYFAPAPSGAMQTGWQKIGVRWYYFNADGEMQTGWQKIGGKWYYFAPAPSGAMQTGWQTINGKTYFLTPGGSMFEGWLLKDGKYYYLSKVNGAMQTGWQNIGVRWYYFNADGEMQTDWQKIGIRWYYFAPGGAMQTGWQKIGGKWYYFAAAPSGAMQTGWQKISGKWYYFAPGGAMQYGWLQLGDRKYFLADGQQSDTPATGEMLEGFHIINGKACFFGINGSLQENWTAENVIVIDPGHSSQIPDWQVPIGPGSDVMKDADNYGTVGIETGVREYELVLDVSLALRDKLEARGYKVVMVRTTNTGVYSCVDRAKVANDNNAAVFLRVHANASSKDHSRTGALTICITDENEFISRMYQKSRLLSDKILDSYTSATGCYNEGVWERDDMIGNNWCTVPTTLIELGYMTNPGEDKLMQTPAYQEKMVNGMLNGIDAYFKALYN